MGQSKEPKARAARWSRAQAMREVEAYRKSGRKLRAWCAERGIPVSRLHYWLTELRHEDGGEQTTSSPFVPIEVREPFTVKSAPTELELVVDGRFELRIPRGFDVPTLQSVLRVLAELTPC